MTTLQLAFYDGPPPTDPDDTWYVIQAGYGWTVGFLHSGVVYDMIGGGKTPVATIHQWARLPDITRTRA